MRKYKILILSLFLFMPFYAYAGFLDSFNDNLHNLGHNLSQNINNIFQKPRYQYNTPIIITEKPAQQKPSAPKATPSPIHKKKIAIIGDWQAFYLGTYLKNLYEKNNYIEIDNIAAGCQDTKAKSCYGSTIDASNQAQLASQIQAVKALQPNLLIIFLGANDLVDNGPQFRPQAEDFLNKVKLVSDHIICLSTPPFHIRPNDKYLENYTNLEKANDVIQKHNEIYKELCELNNLLYIDISQEFNEAYSKQIAILAPDTIGYNDAALKIISDKLQNALEDLSSTVKENYKAAQDFVIIPHEARQKLILKPEDTLDHSPILLGAELENRTNAKLNPQNNAWPPKGRADNFSSY